MADITRDQFDEDKAVVKKILQKQVHLTDADLNEQFDVELNRDRRTLSCLCGHESKRFGDGFKVVGTGASLAVTIKAGFAAFLVDTELAALLRLAEDYTLSGFTTWTVSRTDYIYIDITEEEVDASDDPNIVNPDIGEETCRDIRLSYTFNISEGAAPGTPPANHTYISIATVTKTTGSNIEAGDVSVLVDEFTTLSDDSVTKDMINADVAGAGLTQAGDGTLEINPGMGLDFDVSDALEVDGIKDIASGSELKCRSFEIGSWDMDATASKVITTGLNFATIDRVSVQVMIYADTGIEYPLEYRDPTEGTVSGHYFVGYIGDVNIYRLLGGKFDDVDFDNTAVNRGFVTIWYKSKS